jgi:hypothetical protein
MKIINSLTLVSSLVAALAATWGAYEIRQQNASQAHENTQKRQESVKTYLALILGPEKKKSLAVNVSNTSDVPIYVKHVLLDGPLFVETFQEEGPRQSQNPLQVHQARDYQLTHETADWERLVKLRPEETGITIVTDLGKVHHVPGEEVIWMVQRMLPYPPEAPNRRSEIVPQFR